MKPRTTIRLALVFALALAACSEGHTPEQLVEERLLAMQDFGKVLAKVNDKTTAERHRCEVTKLVKKMNKLRAEFMRLPVEEQRTIEALSKEIAPELQVAQGTMRSEMLRIKPNTEIQRVLGSWLARL
jgi:hypothetical protein